jgi:hypothetical protein
MSAVGDGLGLSISLNGVRGTMNRLKLFNELVNVAFFVLFLWMAIYSVVNFGKTHNQNDLLLAIVFLLLTLVVKR